MEIPLDDFDTLTYEIDVEAFGGAKLKVVEN